MYVLIMASMLSWACAAATDSTTITTGVIEKALESVVGLYVEKTLTDDKGQQAVVPSVGSGVIVDSSGLVLTNAHVIENATTIVAQLNDGTKTFVSVTGVDISSDIALLQLEPRAKYNAIEVGQSCTLKIGTPVTAIGNPFGLSQSVTAGIISGLHRSDHSSKIQDYIQLDAPINPGNSGGALIDQNGRFIGMNTAIISSPGGGVGNIGIGFAIPIEIVLPIYKQLQMYGHTSPGFLGVISQNMNEALAVALNVPSNKGVMITQVVPSSPADTAGLKETDVITHLNDVPIFDAEHLRSMIVAQGQDNTIDLKVYQNGKPKVIKVTTKRPQAAVETKSVFAGIYVIEYDETTLTGLRHTGLRVTHINKDSPALLSGLMPGDVIVAINGHKISKIEDIKGLFSPLRKSYLLHIGRENQSVFVALLP